jgi:hypothetical protein
LFNQNKRSYFFVIKESLIGGNTMKKLLLSTAAVGLVFAAAPASAEIDLNLGGYFKGYGVYADHDEGPLTTDADANEIDMIRDTEIHVGGETALDNGLTVGAHFELSVDGADGSDVDESYVYFSGGWGRFNVGDEDGAAYLLQVAAPSADENVDGIRQFVQPFNYDALIANSSTLNTITTGAGAGSALPAGGLDYDQDVTGKSSKVTYLTPVFSGFQAGLTFSPDNDAADDLEGVGFDNVLNAFGQGYEAAARYEGQFEQVGIILGAGYSHVNLENENAPGALVAGTDFTDDREVWNAGIDLNWGAFGIGTAYIEDNRGERALNAAGTSIVGDEETWVVGADYTTGPFKFGVSYFDVDNTLGFDDLESNRYTGGVTYTYGPGMTFRGSVQYLEHEGNAASNIGGGTDDETDGTAVLLGTQINF